MRRFAAHLFADRRAQDLVEYALLVALVGLVGMAAWSALQTRIGATYTNYDTRTQSLWRPLDPATP